MLVRLLLYSKDKSAKLSTFILDRKTNFNFNQLTTTYTD